MIFDSYNQELASNMSAGKNFCEKQIAQGERFCFPVAYINQTLEPISILLQKNGERHTLKPGQAGGKMLTPSTLPHFLNELTFTGMESGKSISVENLFSRAQASNGLSILIGN